MATPLLIGAGAGLVSAALFASVAVGTALAGILFCLAPLPICLAGLGWGWAAAAAAALSGTVVASMLGPSFGAVFAAIFAPIALLSYLALLSRPGAADAAAATSFEWYPLGRLVGWAAVIAGVLVGAMVLIGYDPETYRDSIKQMIESPAFKELDRDGTLLTEENVDRLSVLVARTLPAMFAVAWLGIALFNLWLAGVIINASGRALRPWPRLDALELPNAFFLAFTASLIASFLPGLPGLLASALASALLFAYVLQGLAVLHVFSRGMPFRTLLLATVYLAILLLGWPALAVAIVGLSEPLLHLRARGAARGQPPSQD